MVQTEVKLKSVLITGPTGTVGVSLINELLSHGIRVTAVVRPASRNRSALPVSEDLQVVEKDLTELLSLKEDLKGPYDAFFHLGWQGTYGDERNDRELQHQNIGITLEAVRLAEALSCRCFVFAGTQSEYGHSDEVLGPDTPCTPVTEYGKAKYEAGLKSLKLCRELGIRHIRCRIFSMYGPGDKPYTMVMSTVLKLLKHERAAFTKGDQIWDYIYNKDAARAICLAAERGRDGAVYPIASGQSRTLRSFIETIGKVVSPDDPLYFGEILYYPNQVMRMEADISALRRDTGFQVLYSFEDGIRETKEWAEKHYL